MTQTSAHRTTSGHRGPVWTRRGALGALSAAGVAAALPSLAGPAGAVVLQDALHGVCLDATKRTAARELGAACAAGRGVNEIEAAIRARVPEAATSEEWSAVLLARARQDLAADDHIDVEGLSLTRTEADVLALGVCLRSSAA